MEIRNWPFFGLLLTIAVCSFYILYEAQNKAHEERTECVENGGRYIKTRKGYECLFDEDEVKNTK